MWIDVKIADKYDCVVNLNNVTCISERETGGTAIFFNSGGQTWISTEEDFQHFVERLSVIVRVKDDVE